LHGKYKYTTKNHVRIRAYAVTHIPMPIHKHIHSYPHIYKHTYLHSHTHNIKKVIIAWFIKIYND